MMERGQEGLLGGGGHNQTSIQPVCDKPTDLLPYSIVPERPAGE